MWYVKTRHESRSLLLGTGLETETFRMSDAQQGNSSEILHCSTLTIKVLMKIKLNILYLHIEHAWNGE